MPFIVASGHLCYTVYANIREAYRLLKPVERKGGPVEERLDSWKEIASYLGRDIRTVQRWARDRSLPIHHLPGGARPRVFSLQSEIDTWLGTVTDGSSTVPVSIAVLPFLCLSCAPKDQFFGDGLAEDVINELVRIPGLRVMARTSSFAVAEKGRGDVRKIGAQLGTTWLLEGSVRREGKRVRVSAQLVNTRDGFHSWSESYDREITGLFEIQDEIARSIAHALELKLTHARTVTETPDFQAYDLWVRGRALSQRFTPVAFAQARECYERAITRDPGFARPYFGLADLLFSGAQFGVAVPPEVVPRARAAIVTSLELDQQFGEAHAVLGIFRGLLDYDWAGSDASFKRALELSPGSATVLSRHAWFNLVPQMQVATALEQAKRAVALDPLSPLAHGHLGLTFVVAREYARAVESCRTAVQLAPGLWWLHWFYATALLLQGRSALGLKHSRMVYEQIHQPLIIGAMAAIYGLFFQRRKAQQLLAELEELSDIMIVPPQAFALAYLGLGDDRVFEWLDRAIDARDPIVTHLPSMPIYDPIRNDPRFQVLLARMGLDRANS